MKETAENLVLLKPAEFNQTRKKPEIINKCPMCDDTGFIYYITQFRKMRFVCNHGGIDWSKE